MIWVGLDLSITNAGVAVLAPGAEPRVSVLKSRPAGYPTGLVGRSRRLADLHAAILDYILVSRPPEAVNGSTAHFSFAVEAPTYGPTKIQGSQHDRAGLWWKVVHSVERLGPIVEISPTALKKFATNDGTATKPEMMARAAQELPGIDYRDDNGCDALWLATMMEYLADVDAGRVQRLKYRDDAVKRVPIP